jgi:hypothetical protein
MIPVIRRDGPKVKGKPTIVVVLAILITPVALNFIPLGAVIGIGTDQATATWYKTWGGGGSEFAFGVMGDGSKVYTCGDTQSISEGFRDQVTIAWDKATGEIAWIRTFGGQGDDQGRGVWTDGTLLLTCGSMTRVVNESWFTDATLLSLNATSGEIIWNATRETGNADIAMAVWCDSVFAYSCGETRDPTDGSRHLALLAWNLTARSIAWNVTWDPGVNSTGYGIWGDEEAVYCCGTIEYTEENNDMVVIAFDKATRAEIWHKTLGGSNMDNGFGAWCDDTAVYTCGITFSGGAGGGDAMVAAWNKTDGSVRWDQTWGGGNFDDFSSITGTSSALYTCGSTLSFGDMGTQGDFVAWNKSTGAIIWDETWGGDHVEMIFGTWCDGTSLFACGYSESFCTSDCFGFGDLVVIKASVSGQFPVVPGLPTESPLGIWDIITFLAVGGGIIVVGLVYENRKKRSGQTEP